MVKVDLNKPVHDFHEKIPRMAISVSICILFVHSANNIVACICTGTCMHTTYMYMYVHNSIFRLIKSREILDLLTIVPRL